MKADVFAPIRHSRPPPAPASRIRRHPPAINTHLSPPDASTGQHYSSPSSFNDIDNVTAQPSSHREPRPASQTRVSAVRVHALITVRSPAAWLPCQPTSAMSSSARRDSSLGEPPNVHQMSVPVHGVRAHAATTSRSKEPHGLGRNRVGIVVMNGPQRCFRASLRLPDPPLTTSQPLCGT